MFEPLADAGIEVAEVFECQPLAVGRVCHHDCFPALPVKVLDVLYVRYYVLGHACRLDVALGGGDGNGVYVVGIYLMLEVPFLGVVVEYLLEKACIKVRPPLKGVVLAEDTRGDVPRDERGFDGNRARPAHGVNEVAVAVPARHHDHPRCQHFVYRCFD